MNGYRLVFCARFNISARSRVKKPLPCAPIGTDCWLRWTRSAPNTKRGERLRGQRARRDKVIDELAAECERLRGKLAEAEATIACHDKNLFVNVEIAQFACNHAQEVARRLLDMFQRDNCCGLDALLKENPWLEE